MTQICIYAETPDLNIRLDHPLASTGIVEVTYRADEEKLPELAL